MDPLTASLVIGGVSAIGQHLSNENNARRADQAATRQQQFQEQMSNTSYQRSAADLKMAGMNPNLAYQNGGASSPAGSAMSSMDQNPLEQMGSSAIQTASLKKELELKGASTDLLKSQQATQETQQELNRSSARAANAGAAKAQSEKEILDSRKSAIKAESAFDEKNALLREKTLYGDYGIEKLNQIMGIGNSAGSIIRRGTKIKEIHVDPKTGEILK